MYKQDIHDEKDLDSLYFTNDFFMYKKIMFIISVSFYPYNSSTYTSKKK